MDNAAMYAMMAEYMEKGFLENIQDMLRHDPSLFPVLPVLIADERMGVRVGAVALAEAMREGFPDELREQLPAIAAHLENENPTFRGDAVYMLSAIGDLDALPILEAHLETHPDEHPAVVAMIREAMEELRQ